jgi:hypothetical protein
MTYRILKETLYSVPKRDIILMGDMNAKVGLDNGLEHIMGVNCWTGK